MIRQLLGGLKRRIRKPPFREAGVRRLNGGIVGFSSNKACHSHYRFTVQGRNLAAFLTGQYASDLGRLAFIKIDVEGYDREILKNLSGIIGRYRPTVVAECFGELNDLLGIPAERSKPPHEPHA